MNHYNYIDVINKSCYDANYDRKNLLNTIIKKGGGIMAKKWMMLDCSACKTVSAMKATTTPKFNQIIRLIGYFIVAPSVFGMIVAVIMLISTGSATSEVMSTAQTDAEAAGAAIGATIGIGASLFVGISSLIGGLIGWLLLMKKKVAGLFEHRPRLAVSTCALATRITADSLRHRGWKKHVPLIVVVIDLYTIHRTWAEPQADSYLVATGEAADSLVRNGISPGRIHRIRFPLSPEFLQPLDQREAQNRLGLDPDATTVLVVGGAGGNGDLTGITRLLDSEFSNLQVLVVTGWNSKLESILREQYRGRGDAIRIYGYTP